MIEYLIGWIIGTVTTAIGFIIAQRFKEWLQWNIVGVTNVISMKKTMIIINALIQIGNIHKENLKWIGKHLVLN